MSIDEGALEPHLAGRAGGGLKGPLHFTGTAPVSVQHAAMWRSVDTMAESAMRNGSADDPLLGPTLANTVATACLARFPSNWSDDDRSPRSQPTAAIRMAGAFIEEHAHEPVTLSDIAVAGRLSSRALQAAFRSGFGVSPMTYLRQVRLEHARAALRASDPTYGASVAAIARAAGFANLGRFAAAYRDRFGEYPGHDLMS